MKKIAYTICIATLLLSACVPQRLLEETKTKLASCETEVATTRKLSQDAESKLATANETLTKNIKDITGLQRDTSIMASNLRLLQNKYDKLNFVNDQLLDKYNKMLVGSERDNAKLSGQLQLTQEQLLRKEDELKALEAKLNKQQQDLDAISAQLKLREARVNELESILKKKDQATADLKKKLQDALFNFENKGLTITQKNGKVYVSMDESLLFASGKTAVEPKGVEALKKCSKSIRTKS